MSLSCSGVKTPLVSSYFAHCHIWEYVVRYLPQYLNRWCETAARKHLHRFWFPIKTFRPSACLQHSSASVCLDPLDFPIMSRISRALLIVFRYDEELPPPSTPLPPSPFLWDRTKECFAVEIIPILRAGGLWLGILYTRCNPGLNKYEV